MSCGERISRAGISGSVAQSARGRHPASFVDPLVFCRCDLSTCVVLIDKVGVSFALVVCLWITCCEVCTRTGLVDKYDLNGVLCTAHVQQHDDAIRDRIICPRRRTPRINVHIRFLNNVQQTCAHQIHSPAQ